MTSRLSLHIPLLFLFLFLAVTPAAGEEQLSLHFFWGRMCSHCEDAREFLASLQKRYPRLVVRDHEVSRNPDNMRLLATMAKELGVDVQGVPAVFVGDRVFSGFSEEIGREIETEIRRRLEGRQGPSPSPQGTAVTLPFVGTIDSAAISLPLFTVVIAALDSFNPCAFFVLFFLLSLLIHAHSRLRILLIGGSFVLVSGLFYFLFMAAWLNLFLLAGQLRAITATAGGVALLIALINIKDFFYFRAGVSLSIPEEAKPRLFSRMRRLVGAGSIPSLMAGTLVLAVAANSYELLCTAGFPMIFTRVLTLSALPAPAYYLYLLLYNGVYVIPLAVIVILFAITLGSRKLSEWQGRVLKLISGTMMLCLGAVLLVNPALLNSPLLSLALLALSLAISGLIVRLTKKRLSATTGRE